MISLIPGKLYELTQRWIIFENVSDVSYEWWRDWKRAQIFADPGVFTFIEQKQGAYILVRCVFPAVTGWIPLSTNGCDDHILQQFTPN